MEEYYYHYTSLDTLKKILASKCFRFTRLDLVDDTTECIAHNIKNFGAYFFISSWSKSSDSFPLWEAYGVHQKGICIGLKENPFNFDSLNRMEIGYEAFLTHDICTFKPITFTDDKEILYPYIFRESTLFNYCYTNFGYSKKKYWASLDEYRYSIPLLPMVFHETNSFKSVSEYIKFNIKFLESNVPSREYLDITIKDEAIRDMTIMLGPCTTHEDWVDLNDIIKEYNISEQNITRSSVYGEIRR